MSRKKADKAPGRKAGQTFVYVSCKAPTGLLAELGDKGSEGYEKVLLKGANQGTFNPRDGRFTANTIGGFGMTEVPTAFWDRWQAANAAFVRNWQAQKLMNVANSRDEAEAWQLDNAESASGFEPLDPDKMPKGLEAAPIGPQVE